METAWAGLVAEQGEGSRFLRTPKGSIPVPAETRDPLEVRHGEPSCVIHNQSIVPESMSNPAPAITVTELKERLDNGERVTIIDVREPYEWDISNLEEYGAKLIPMGELRDRLDEVKPDVDTVFQCRSGNRSGQVVSYLRKRGYDRVWNLEGGILAWSDQVDSSKTKY